MLAYTRIVAFVDIRVGLLSTYTSLDRYKFLGLGLRRKHTNRFACLFRLTNGEFPQVGVKWSVSVGTIVTFAIAICACADEQLSDKTKFQAGFDLALCTSCNFDLVCMYTILEGGKLSQQPIV